MIKHFGIFSDSSDLQAAYNNGDIINPYVALVGGELDYNSLQPCYLGEWSDDGAGHYTFQILDADATAWGGGVQIGTLLNVYFNGSDEQINMPVRMTYDGSDVWFMEYIEPEESSNQSYHFQDGVPDNWTCDAVMTDPNSSTAQVQVEWDGVDTFVFSQMSDESPDLSMSTINPECPPVEESGSGNNDDDYHYEGGLDD